MSGISAPYIENVRVRNNFIIELKSHIGRITWNSELKKLCQQLGKDPKPKPFERDFFNNLNKQAKLLRNAWNLSQSPNKVLVFWRAEIRISSKKRLQRGVKISEKSRIVKDLEKRDRKLVEKKVKHSSERESSDKRKETNAKAIIKS